jgi:hypothetical protein
VLRPVMSPAEIDYLVLDLRSELAALTDTPEQSARLAHFHALLEGFCKDWRQLYLLHGENASGWSEFSRLRDGLRATSRELTDKLIIRGNRTQAQTVLEGRVLRAALSLPATDPGAGSAAGGAASRFDRPVLIVAAPRSGSTLLFETLAASNQLVTLGGEAHWLVESIAELRLGAAGVTSNRLEAEHCTAEISNIMLTQIVAALRNAAGDPIPAGATVRFLEKTPKNALRIPFFNRLFPDALFIFLWRDPQENLSSIMEAWRSGQFKTYNGLNGLDGPWSLLLPPGWQSLGGRPLEEIAAFQWEATNRIVLDDLAVLPRHRWISVNYADLVATPAVVVERLCQFMGIPADAGLKQRTLAPLPLARCTLTPPAADKWRRNEVAIGKVLPGIEATWQRLKALN